MLLIEEKQLHSGLITVCCTEGAVGDYGIIRNSHSRNWYCSWEILYNGWSSHSAFFCQNGPVRAAGWHPPEMLHSWRKSVGQNDDQKFTSFCCFFAHWDIFWFVILPTFLSDIPKKISPIYRSRHVPRHAKRQPLGMDVRPQQILASSFHDAWLRHGGTMAGMMDPNMGPVGKSSPKMVTGRAKKGFCPWFWTNAEIYI